MEFKRETDAIAITIPAFRMRHSADLGRNEIGIVSIAIDENGVNNPNPSVFTNSFFIPNVKKWTWCKFGGNGRIIYGPKNPGSFVYYNVLFVESDQDVRDFGNTLNGIFSSDEAKSILKTLSATNPTTLVISSVLTELGKLVGAVLSKNKNDIIYSTEGSFFRNVTPPYNIGDRFSTVGHHVECEVSVLPLIAESDLISGDNEDFVALVDTKPISILQKSLRLEMLSGIPNLVTV